MYTDKDNGKRYIGQSVNIKQRKKSHRNSNKTPFDRILNSKGEDHFEFTILEECNIEQLNEREIYWIDYYNSYYDGYNYTPGGVAARGQNASGATITDETAKKIIQDLSTTNLLQKEIAEKYGCSEDVVRSINVCRCWTHLHNYENNISLESGIKQTAMPTYLTIEEILEIIELLANTDIPQMQIAEEYNVSRHLIGDINNCHKYTELHNYNNNIREESNILYNKLYIKSKLTKEQALEVIKLLSTTTMTQGEIANKFNVTSGTIYNINACNVYTEYHSYKNNIREESGIIKTNHHIPESIIKEIINLLANTKLTQQQIAKKFNISDGTVYAINNCHSYNHLHSYTNNIRKESQNINSRPLNEEKVLEIIDLLKNTTLSQQKIADQYKISRSMVGLINQCKSWTHLHNYKHNIRKETQA